jgi:hypothetical protein
LETRPTALPLPRLIEKLSSTLFPRNARFLHIYDANLSWILSKDTRHDHLHAQIFGEADLLVDCEGSSEQESRYAEV